MKIIGIALNGVGLGHFHRILAIFKELKQIDSNIDLLILTKSEFITTAFHEKIPVVKLPSSQALGDSKERFLSLYKKICINVISEFDPDLLVIDSRLSGLFGETIDTNILEKYYVCFINRLVKKTK